jgi:hypothetical protein
MFEGDFVLVSTATNRAVDESDEIGEIFDTLQNLNPSGFVVRMRDWALNRNRKERLMTVAELPAEDFLNSSDPFRALIQRRR